MYSATRFPDFLRNSRNTIITQTGGRNDCDFGSIGILIEHIGRITKICNLSRNILVSSDWRFPTEQNTIVETVPC